MNQSPRTHCWTSAERFSAFLALVLLSGLAPAGAPTDNASDQAPASAGTDFASFKVVTDRNIFNSARSARSARQGEETKAPRVETVTLVGTMIYEKGPYAFFDGSSSEFRKALEPGKNIAGYKIAGVTGTSVMLEASTNTVELQVGMQLRREEDGAWEISGGAIAPASGTAGSKAAELSSKISSADESDMVKRMMQQREQDLK